MSKQTCSNEGWKVGEGPKKLKVGSYEGKENQERYERFRRNQESLEEDRKVGK